MGLFALMTVAAAQEVPVEQSAQGSNIPAYRAKGYKGSVSLTSLGLYWEGVETSHGYMFNDKVYLGAGAGLLIGTIYDAHPALRAFADFQAYWLPRKSTLTTKVRAGYLRHFYGEDDMFEGTLTLGWSWGIASYGISLDAGMSALVPPGNFLVAGVNQTKFSLAPVISLSFEF